MSLPLLTTALRAESDVVAARRRARQVAGLLGFDAPEQTRLATAVSEMARNACQYAGGGSVDFLIDDGASPQALVVRIRDQGPGIPNLREVLDGLSQAPDRAGLGLAGARRLVDRFEIDSAPGRGTTVTLRKTFPRRAPAVSSRDLGRLAVELARHDPSSALQEVEQQDRELLQTLEELRRRQEDLERLNQELTETNRGVVALYAELDDKAQRLGRADELKSRFLSYLSHEFRTPVLSTLSLARLMLERTDGELTSEQERQVYLIRKSMEGLAELVNDLLDLAKVEAGKIEVRPVSFRVADLFGTLRGMFRPLATGSEVALVFEEVPGLPPLSTDESKVAQILRNFISNALKFTEKGEVRVSARLHPEQPALVFAVADTGIGIAPGDMRRVFQEFTQVDGPVQRRVKGTGLGLSLSKKLAELLGGRVYVESEPGVGSTFYAVLPLVYRAALPAEPAFPPLPALDPTRHPVLVIEDSPETVQVYEKYVQGHGFQVLPVSTVAGARKVLRDGRPAAVILDTLLSAGEDSWGFLAELKEAPATRDLPVLVASMVDVAARARALGADDCCVKPLDRRWLLARLKEYASRRPVEELLVIDDDEVCRYLLREALTDTRFTLVEAAGGAEGLQRAAADRPRAVFLDLVMPGMSGFEVLDALRADPRTADLPVIIHTSRPLAAAERARLEPEVVAFLDKGLPREEASRRIRDALRCLPRRGGTP